MFHVFSLPVCACAVFVSLLQAPIETATLSLAELSELHVRIDCAPPNAELYKFDSTMHWDAVDGTSCVQPADEGAQLAFRMRGDQFSPNLVTAGPRSFGPIEKILCFL
jgi:hypothetical protein